jgi:hypothetical protein
MTVSVTYYIWSDSSAAIAALTAATESVLVRQNTQALEKLSGSN